MNSLLKKADILAGSRCSNLSLHFLGSAEMARANEDILGHSGCTDVITLDYRSGTPAPEADDDLVELLVCPDQALAEGARHEGYAREMVLYIVHGLLHASGEDDLTPSPRKRMRQREREVLSELEKHFDFDKLFSVSKNT